MSRQNFTIDDSDVTLLYGPGWGVASPNDPALDNYFQSTYHATRTLGANVTLSFSGEQYNACTVTVAMRYRAPPHWTGVAIYLFGSRGPNHGNFSVRYDNLVQLLSAHANSLSYRQPLFSASFPKGNHSVTVTNTDNTRSWFDLDFVTVTGTTNISVPTGFSSTIPPPSLLPTAATTQANTSSPTSSGSSPVPATSSSTSNSTTFILSIAFGAFIFFLLLGAAFYYLIRRRRDRNRGHGHGNPSFGTDTGDAPMSVRSAGSAFLRPQSIQPMQPPSSYLYSYPYNSPTSEIGSHAHTPLSPSGLNAGEPGSGGAESQTQMRQWGHSPPAVRPWSPFSTLSPINRMFSAAKDGADSMKSTFLKV